jgi:hypothetical protein
VVDIDGPFLAWMRSRRAHADIIGSRAEPGFHPEGRYEFKVHFEGAEFEDLTYRIAFEEPDADGQHPLRLYALTGTDAREDGSDGELLLGA